MANILIIEDTESIRQAYSGFLQHEGHNVTTAGRVEEALEYLSSNTPDLILLDMLMPKTNGLEFLRQYEIRNEHKGVKVIAFSNLQELRIQEEALALGVSFYINKSSTTPQELIDQVNAVLAL